MGEKFSRETIKNAIWGNEDNEPELMHHELIPRSDFESPQKPMSGEKINEKMKRISPMEEMRKNSEGNVAGPVFVRIDRFEESLRIFRETKEKINEIEKLLEDTKNLKGKEETELSNWENEIQEMKRKIERVNSDIFSKV